MLKFFYEKFWYPIFGRILSKFVFLIEGSNYKKISKLSKNQDQNKI